MTEKAKLNCSKCGEALEADLPQIIIQNRADFCQIVMTQPTLALCHECGCSLPGGVSSGDADDSCLA